ncbi:MAG: sugar nucleotide-binding protein [Candidatus Berkelbacteria bacterium]|nr:sugar nucleotide-binding protein [Candidatus Berkelbacteria bacterium]
MAKKTVAVLGCTGMLGSMVLDVFSRDRSFKIIATGRNKKEILRFSKKYPKVGFLVLDVETADENTLKKALKGAKWAINCIGIIKPYIHDDNAIEVERAIRVNSLYPHLLAKAATKLKAKVIQIETDCSFSGKKGDYTEDDEHDPTDVYGKTKSLGEAKFPNVYHLRDSIIGPEISAHVSLLDWFLTQPKGAKVNGFANHKWNGVTTLHFARICLGIIKNNLKIPNFQHIIAADKPSKAQMLNYFAKYFDRTDIKITPVKAPKVVDRTLATKNPKENARTWKAAGYKKPPMVGEMIGELALYVGGER